MDPRVARALLAEAVEEALIRFGVGCSPDELPEVFDRISVCYQGLGIALVLMTGERTRFRECLVRSAWARLHLLQVATTLQPPPRQRATSYGEGFLDAVAAGHWLVAGEIAALSPSDWVPEGEYEDDFCYFRLLFGFADEVPPPAAAVAALLARFARALEGQPSPRLALCTSLAARDAAGFAEAFSDFLRARREADDEARGRLGEPDADTALFWMRSFVSVEAIALLRLARAAGIAQPGPHPLCPPGVIPVGPCPNYPDFILELEAAR